MKSIAEVMLQSHLSTHTVDYNISVYQAVEKLQRNSLGSLLVIRDGALVGVLSERDCTRKMILENLDPHETKVCDIMTTNVVTVTPEQEAEACLGIMYKNDIRHLPVVTEEQEIVGFLSVLEIVHELLAEKTKIVMQLEDYVSETWPI